MAFSSFKILTSWLLFVVCRLGWNVSFKSFENAVNWVFLMMHRSLYHCSNCWFSILLLRSWQTNTYFLIGYFSCDWYLPTKSFSYFPLLYVCLGLDKHQKIDTECNFISFLLTVTSQFLTCKVFTVSESLSPFIAIWF